MKKVDLILRVLLVLLCVSPVLGTLGIFPAPTRDMYNTDGAFAFITMMMTTGYLIWAIAGTFAIVLVLTIMNRMALAALLLLPLVVNIIGFHAFLDGGLFTAGSSMALVLAGITVYFLYRNRSRYEALLAKSN